MRCGVTGYGILAIGRFYDGGLVWKVVFCAGLRGVDGVYLLLSLFFPVFLSRDGLRLEMDGFVCR